MKHWIPPELFTCPEIHRRCLGEICTLWDKANKHCIRYEVGWVYEEKLEFILVRKEVEQK